MSKEKIVGTVNSENGFFVGDVTYVLSDEDFLYWDDELDLKDGCHEIRGYKFAVAATAYGDDTYLDNHCNEYDVDGGVIGVVPIELCSIKNVGVLDGYGRYVYGDTAEFTCEDGVFSITIDDDEFIEIDTNYDRDDEDDEY